MTRPGALDEAARVLRQPVGRLSGGGCPACGASVALSTGEEPENHRAWHAAVAVLAAAVARQQ